MKYLQNKIVLITGAGFSAPANLPIQDKILQQMSEPQSLDFMQVSPDTESIKFLTAYIKVAIYLLKEYGNCDIREIDKKFSGLVNNYDADNRVLEILNYIQSNYEMKANEKNFNIADLLNSTADNFIIEHKKYYFELLAIKEILREMLEKKKLQINLEDVFTVFDKSIVMRENTSNYTYGEMDSLQHSVLRLFTYYFSKKVNQHNYDKEDYKETISYLKKNSENISIITTNWDILLEQYMIKSGIEYNYSFNSSYVVNSLGELYENESCKSIKYLKIHGSINWFRCLKCGTLQVCKADECGQYLFDDDTVESCIKCGQVACGSNVQVKPEIITPTMMKLINSQLYNNLWQNAAYELQQADKIIFCGYSLPIADFEFRYLLKQNISKKAQIDVVLYHNDNPAMLQNRTLTEGFLPEKRFMDLFANNTCNFYYEGFGKYFFDNK